MSNKLEKAVKRILNAGAIGGNYDPAADPEGVVFRPDAFSAKYHASTTILVKDIGALLDKHFPGWAWVVEPDERNQIINIFNWHLHDQFGYTIRMVDIMYDPARREAVKGAAEVLRRFGMPARGLTGDASSLLAALPRDAKGKVIPDISDWKDSKIRRNREIALALAQGRASTEQMDDGSVALKLVGV